MKKDEPFSCGTSTPGLGCEAAWPARFCRIADVASAGSEMAEAKDRGAMHCGRLKEGAATLKAGVIQW